jgi:hypothetical protein
MLEVLNAGCECFIDYFVVFAVVPFKVTPIQSIVFDDDTTEGKSLSASKVEKLLLPMLALVMVLRERLQDKYGKNKQLPKQVLQVLDNYLSKGVDTLDLKVGMPAFIDEMSEALGLREKRRVAKVTTYLVVNISNRSFNFPACCCRIGWM